MTRVYVNQGQDGRWAAIGGGFAAMGDTAVEALGAYFSYIVSYKLEELGLPQNAHYEGEPHIFVATWACEEHGCVHREEFELLIPVAPAVSWTNQEATA